MQAKAILALLVALPVLTYAQDKSSEKDILTVYKGAHSYKEVSVAGKTTEVYVDDQKLADGEIPRIDSLIRTIKNDVDEDDRQWRQRDEEQDRDWAQAERDRVQAQREREQRDRDREQADRDREQRDREREQARFEREQGQREREQARLERDRDRQQAEQDRQQAERDRRQGELDRAQGERDRERAREDRTTMRAILQYLVDQKIAPDLNHVRSLVLTDAALYVNGVKQPDPIHQTLKGKYGDWAHNGLSYGDCQAPDTYIHIDLSDNSCCQ